MPLLKIDTREKDDVLIYTLIQKCEDAKIPFEMTALPVGDFLWELDGTQVCIEHKSIEDLFASKSSRHLDTQMLDIKQYPNYILLIDGKWQYGKRGYGRPIYPELRDGLLLSVCLRDRVPYHHVDNSTQLADCIMRIKDLVLEGDRVDTITRHSKTKNKGDANLAMFLQIPGLGERRATRLRESVGSFGYFIHSVCECGNVEKAMQSFGLKKSDLPKGAREFVEELCYGVD
jgi:ERCC4-type nuclease